MENPSQPGPQAQPWVPRNPYGEDSRRKSPLVASVMSVMPGLGQIYVGYYVQGFVNSIVVASLIAVLNQNPRHWEPLLGMFLAFFWLYNIVDAGRRAALYNYALAGLEPDELPELIRIPQGRSSLAAGVALLALGSMLLAHTRWGYSLEWLEYWWPLGLVLLGAYLVATSLLTRRAVAGS